MPFIDCNTEFENLNEQSFDYTIIGAGAAGILLAVKLSEIGKTVLLIESGHFEEDAERQQLNIIEQTGKDLTSSVSGRKRAVGGTTIAWGGQSLPFSPLDFIKREWVQNSGWPIQVNELDRYYKEANRFMQVDELDYEDDIFKMLKMKKQPFDAGKLWYHFSKWAPEPNFRKLYNTVLQERVTVLYNAVTTNIISANANNAEAITIKNFNGNTYNLKVKRLLVACGAIESTRLLLASQATYNNGIGNHAGWLGKCFMEHPCIEIGFVQSPRQYKLQAAFNTHIHKGRKYSVRLTIAEKAQTEQKLLNASAGVMFDYLEDKFDPYIEIREYIRTKKISSLAGVASNSYAYLLSAKAYIADKFYYKHKARARVVMMLEQEPLADSRITLSEQTDRLGMHKAKLNWQITKKTWDTVVYTSALVKDEIHRLGFGTLNIHSHITESNTNWQQHLSDVNHHMGGARMSADSSSGVVNKSLQVWGCDNVYVCSTAIFPTVSHSNPTLTLLALCLRLVDELESSHNNH